MSLLELKGIVYCPFCNQPVDVEFTRWLVTAEGSKVRGRKFIEQNHFVNRLYIDNKLEHTCRQRLDSLD